MGAEESKQRGEDEDEQLKKTALAIGAWVGTALLGVAWGVSHYRANTSDTDQRLQQNHHYSDCDSDSEPEYQLGSRGVVPGGLSRYRANASDIDQRLQHRYADSDSDSDSEPEYQLGSRGVVPGGVSRYRANASDIDQRLQHRYADYEPESRVRPQVQTRNFHVSNYKFKVATKTLKILSYNVCSREKYVISKRMNAIIELVPLHSPDFICFQEITPDIYKTFERSPWWKDYYCSVSKEEANEKRYFCILLCKINPIRIIKAPIGSPSMVRELCVMETKLGNKSLVVATSHLKSACPVRNDASSQYHQFNSEHLCQASEALTILKKYPNVMFGGDMNWNEETDGEFPLPEGWVDAWTKLRGEEEGYTFDTESNGMLDDHRHLRRRLDRILCNLKGFKLHDIEIIGKDPIPDVSYQGKTKMLPVLPSDHYGLLLTVCTTELTLVLVQR